MNYRDGFHLKDYIPPSINAGMEFLFPTYKKSNAALERTRMQALNAARAALKDMSHSKVTKSGRVITNRSIDAEQKERFKRIVEKHNIQNYRSREDKLLLIDHMVNALSIAGYLPVVGTTATVLAEPLAFAASVLHLGNAAVSAVETGNYLEGLQRVTQVTLPIIVSTGITLIAYDAKS